MSRDSSFVSSVREFKNRYLPEESVDGIPDEMRSTKNSFRLLAGSTAISATGIILLFTPAAYVGAGMMLAPLVTEPIVIASVSRIRIENNKAKGLMALVLGYDGWQELNQAYNEQNFPDGNEPENNRFKNGVANMLGCNSWQSFKEEYDLQDGATAEYMGENYNSLRDLLRRRAEEAKDAGENFDLQKTCRDIAIDAAFEGAGNIGERAERLKYHIANPDVVIVKPVHQKYKDDAVIHPEEEPQQFAKRELERRNSSNEIEIYLV